MKKVQIIIVVLVLLSLSSLAQIGTPGCIQCKDNIVSSPFTSSALGRNNTSKGLCSFAGGEGSEAMEEYSFSFGKQAKVNKKSSIAFGYECETSGMYSVSIGRQSKVIGAGSIAIGLSNNAMAGSSFLFGELLKSTAGETVVIGIGGSNNHYLINNKSKSLMVGFRSIYPTLFVEGEGSQNYDRTGHVGIGNVTSPEAKLHIRADDDEDASLKLEPTVASKYARILFGNDGHGLSTKQNDDFRFSTQQGKDFLFENGNIVQAGGYHVSTDKVLGSGGLQLHNSSGYGINIEPGGNVGIGCANADTKLEVNGTFSASGNVGIGTDNPQHKLEVSGDIHLTGTLFNDEGPITSSQWTSSGNDVYFNDGNVGIQTTNPQYELDVTGDFNLTGTLYNNGNPVTSSQWITSGNDIFFNDGNVGIGTTNPATPLSINKDVSSGGSVGINIVNTNTFPWFIGMNYSTANSLIVADYNDIENPYFVVNNFTGNVGIGTTNTNGNKLAVKGKIVAQEVNVEAMDWYDHVFSVRKKTRSYIVFNNLRLIS